MAKARKRFQENGNVKPAVPADEVEDYAHPASGGHHVTAGYDPYLGHVTAEGRRAMGTDRFIEDGWLEMPPVKRPADDPHDYDYDGE
jgi:hypothetical protein